MNLLHLSQVLVIIGLISVLYRLSKSLALVFRLHDLMIGLSGLGYAILLTMRIIYNDFELLLHTDFIVLVYEWFRILSVSLLLCGLGLMVRDSKPNINRAPLVLSLIPLLLLAIHPFVLHTIVLKEVLIHIYLGGALFIAFILFSLKSYNSKTLLPILYGTLLLLIGFVFEQVPVAFFSFCEPIQLLIIFVSTIFISTHYLNQKKEDYKQIEIRKQHLTV